MVTRRFCDRCDKQLKLSEMKYIIISGRLTRYEVCDVCFKKLRQWLSLP